MKSAKGFLLSDRLSNWITKAQIRQKKIKSQTAFLLCSLTLFLYSLISSERRCSSLSDSTLFNSLPVHTKGQSLNPKLSLRCPDKFTYSTVQTVNKSVWPKPSFKVVVITYDRHLSLRRCLDAVNHAQYDGMRIDLLIFIDRSYIGNISSDVLAAAQDYQWSHGAKYVNVWDTHVGLYGQWVDSFKPTSSDDYAIILEDDIEVSPYYYKWLSGARAMYTERNDIFGYTLQRGTLRADQRKSKKVLRIGDEEPAFLYLLLGSWGYAPEPKAWTRFRTWFHNVSCDDYFNPQVEGLVPSLWFRNQRKAKTMWTMWHIRFADDQKLYTVYANLQNSKTLGANWREAGLHFGNKSPFVGHKDFERFMDSDYAKQGAQFFYPLNPVKLDWNGTFINRLGARVNE